ncbi:hypothetical protein XH90_31815 [Bradyrhizobium sp. CCBAU 53338]|nr:hypothetical protein XH90_31815 [Bradyrhizobium sp. CCBAU 53338]
MNICSKACLTILTSDLPALARWIVRHVQF